MSEVLLALSQYDLSIKEIIPVQENVFRIEAKEGVYGLKCATKREEKINFVVGVLDHLTNQGFCKISFPVLTSDNAPLVNVNGKVYFLTKWIKGRSCNFRRKDHLTAAVKTLAKFHQYAYELPSLPGAKGRVMYWQWPKTLQKRTQELKDFLGYIEGKKTITDFERLYLSIGENMAERGEMACQTLATSGYFNLAKEAEKAKTFIHRDVAARNFIIGPKKEAYLIDFDYCRYDLRVVDVVRLMERALRSERWPKKKGKLILKTYHRSYPLKQSEYQVMLAFFQFPQKIWRLSHRYFIKKYPWPEKEYLDKLTLALWQIFHQDKFIHFFQRKYCDQH